MDMDPELASYDVRPMDALVARAPIDRRTPMLLAIGFALVALVLCAIGIYGVLAYEVRLRTREVLGEGAILVAAGALAGLGGSFLLRRAIESQLYQVQATDPVVFSAVAGLLLLVAAFACALPARRAMSTNPSVALSDQ